MMIYEIQNTDYFMHYGVPGMKWGVRKDRYKSMSRSERKSAKAKYKSNMKANREQYKTAKKKASKVYERDISEYTKASDKLNNKFDRDSYNIERKHKQYADKVSTYAGNNPFGERIKENIKISEMNKKRVVEGKRTVAQDALDEKYQDMLAKASSKYSSSVKSARKTYKSNKKKIKSGTYK